MKKITLIFLLLITGLSQAQEKGIIKGFVLDKQLQSEPLAFVTISLKETAINTSTNIDGAYVFEVKSGIYTLTFNFPGYQKVEVANVIVNANKITSIKNIELVARTLVLTQQINASKKEK